MTSRAGSPRIRFNATSGQNGPAVAYSTDLGQIIHGTIEDAFETSAIKAVRGEVNLLFTSPPFPLLKKKKYGNLTGPEYLNWMTGLAGRLADLLAPDGSLVIANRAKSIALRSLANEAIS